MPTVKCLMQNFTKPRSVMASGIVPALVLPEGRRLVSFSGSIAIIERIPQSSRRKRCVEPGPTEMVEAVTSPMTGTAATKKRRTGATSRPSGDLPEVDRPAPGQDDGSTEQIDMPEKAAAPLDKFDGLEDDTEPFGDDGG